MIAAAVIFVLLWLGLYKRSKAKVSYNCTVCNEKHCNCEKDNAGS